MIKGLIKGLFALLTLMLSLQSLAQQLPSPSIVGYWEAWDNNNRFVRLSNIDSRYNVICVAFAEYNNGKDYDVHFTAPNNYDSDQEFRSEIEALQAEGKKVLISLGGQTTPHVLDSTFEKETFVTSVNDMIDYWGFDGLDIDLEGGSIHFDDINIDNPGDTRQILFIEALREIIDNHLANNSERLLLTMAPETAYVQGGLSQWTVDNAYGGAYLPIIEAFRDDIDMLNVQLYNSGTVYGLDGNIYSQSNPEFVLALTEAVIEGFSGVSNLGDFSGLPASKIGVALPGCHSSDAVPHDELEQTMNYLLGNGPQIGNYTLRQEGGYPDLKGMMTWSINSDRGCTPSYGFVNTYFKVFGVEPYIILSSVDELVEQNEDGAEINIELHRSYFEASLDVNNWTAYNLPEGVSIGSVTRDTDSTATVTLEGNSIDRYSFANTSVGFAIDKAELTIQLIDSVYEDYGLVFKTLPSPIPGTIQAEALADYLNVKRGNTKATYWQGEWAEYDIDVEEANDYLMTFVLQTSTQGNSIRVSLDGSTLSSFSFTSSSGFSTVEEQQTSVYLPEGLNTIRITSSNAWFVLDSIIVEPGLTNGVNTVTRNQAFFYPNPASESIVVSEKGELKIFTIRGELVRTYSITEEGQSIDIADLETGIYLIETNTDYNYTIRNKLMKN